MKKKFRSFTLIELAVVFLLTAFCVSIAYVALLSTNKGMDRFKQNADQTWEATLFYTILYQDFFESQIIWQAPSGIICEQKDRQITYYFNSNWVLRENNNDHIDTFQVKTSGFNSAWQHEDLVVSNGLVNEVWLKCKIGDKEHAFNLHKIYATDVVLNATN